MYKKERGRGTIFHSKCLYNRAQFNIFSLSAVTTSAYLFTEEKNLRGGRETIYNKNERLQAKGTID